MSAGFLLAGCATIDDLRTAISQWFESATFPDGREEALRDVPTANPITPPEAKQEVANAPSKVAKPALAMRDHLLMNWDGQIAGLLRGDDVAVQRGPE